MVSALTQEGADVTLQALEFGAVDFMPKPERNQLAEMRASRDLTGHQGTSRSPEPGSPATATARGTAIIHSGGFASTRSMSTPHYAPRAASAGGNSMPARRP